MSDFRLTHLDDATLLRDLATIARQDRATTAALLAHIAEVDTRRLYLPSAYPSMFAYCVGELGLSEDAAGRRIQAARAARAYPRLFVDLAAGRLHLTAVGLLAPYLTPGNAEDLIAAATGRRKAEIEAMLASRFGFAPAAALPTRLIAVGPRSVPDSHAPAHTTSTPRAPGGPVLAPAQPDPPQPIRFVVQFPIGEATHTKLRHAQDLLGHAVADGDLAAVFDRALDALIARLEKRKVAATERPRRTVTPVRGRTVSARVRRAVSRRDGDRCTFTSASGRRCDSRRGLEFDHVVPFARGGQATVEGLRLRCRAHNQFEAERAFGTEFMRRKRTEARRGAAWRKGNAQEAPDPEIESALRGLGCRAVEARNAAFHAASLGAAAIEERLRGALQYLGTTRRTSPSGRSSALP